MSDAKRDNNNVTTLLAVSNVDGETPVSLYADPVTHRLLVSTVSAGSATTALDNLASVAINTSLISDTDGTDDIGSTSIRWKKGWFDDMETTNMPTVGGTAILSSLTAPQFTTIELGHATDTTLSRTSAGDVNIEGNIVYRAGGTDVPVTDGGTGSSTASGARTNLGLAIGSDVQAWDADLDTIAGLSSADGNFIVGSATGWVVESGATARTSLGLAIGTDVQAHGDVLDDFNTLGAATADSQFIVATGAGAFAYESGATARTSLGLGATDNPTFNDLTVDKTTFNETASFDAETDNGNSGTADTIDWGVGNKQKSTLTGNVTYTFTAPAGPCNLLLKIVQDATGSRTATWPATVKWPGGTAPTLSTAANAVDIVTCYYDGTNYYCQSGLNFS